MKGQRLENMKLLHKVKYLKRLKLRGFRNEIHQTINTCSRSISKHIIIKLKVKHKEKCQGEDGEDFLIQKSKNKPTADFNNKWYQVNYPCSKQQKQCKAEDNVISSKY